MKRTRIRFLTVTLLAAILLAAGCGSDDEDDTPAAEYQVLGGRLVWCAETLESLTVPDSASSIGNNAFNNCPALTRVTIPATVEKIGSGTFYGVAVREITYMSTMRAWDTLARASGIVSTLADITVTCTDGIWRAGMYDWEITDGVLTRYCGDAADVKIPGNVTVIGEAAFEGRADITGVTIPGGVTAIGDGAFRDCAKLTGVTIPAGVTVIGENAFTGCASLTKIDIPASVETIGAGALPVGTAVTYHGTKAQWESLAANAGLDGVTAFVIDGSGTLTGYCGSAASITLPDGVNGIAGGAFAGHEGLKHIVIPAGVTAIGAGAFNGSGVTEISYGGTVAEWGALVESGGIAAEVADITVRCADGTWTPAHTHDWGAYTDGGDGTHRRTCAGCGRTESAPHGYDGAPYERGDGGHYKICTTAGCNAHSPVEAHQYGDEVCTDAGHAKTCSLCTYSMTAPHSWSSYTDDKDGNHSRTCTVEGFTAHAETKAHEYGTSYSDNKDGTHYQTCAVCGGTSDPVAHDYEYKDNADGSHTKTCTADCGYSETEEHTWGSETCTDTEHSKSCTLCTYSASKPHDWGAYSDDKDGSHHSRTCAIEGFKAHSETKAHEYGTGYTDNKDGKHYQTCSVCSAKSEAVAHECKHKDNADGTHTTTCTKCEYSTTEEHRYKDDTCEDCGCPDPTKVYVASTGRDTNAGSRAAPFATIQKAVDAVIANNDGTSAYTIYVDGTLTQATAGADGMADFSALDKNLTLTIKALSGTATLDAGGKSRVMKARPAGGILKLMLENLVITGGNASDNGGGIYIEGSALTMKDCTVTGNTTKSGGGVYNQGGEFTMTGGTISGNTASINGGGVFNNGGTFEMSDGTISGNKAYYGGGVYVDNGGTFKMSDGTISDNTVTSGGGGVYINRSASNFTMSGGAIENNKVTYSYGYGGGVYVSGGTFNKNGGTISGNTPDDVYPNNP
ncbi:MAG: leucine-rich repeat protein [Treponemataceae bacterium]|nr:leucine-rich repeat protein [Treponemataceae bacterium]